MTSAVFLDRDGVINRNPPVGEYIANWGEMVFLPGVEQAIAQLNRAGFRVVVVTNQRGVALGKVGLADVEDIHQRMVRHLAGAGAEIAGVYFCPHDLPLNCDCRKPRPGLLLRAARDLALDLAASWMVGDNLIDIQAGHGAGCRTVGIGSAAQHPEQPDLLAENLPDAAAKIIARSRRAAGHTSALPASIQG